MRAFSCIGVEIHPVRRQANAPTKTKAAIRRIPLSDEMTKEPAALKRRSPFSADDDPVFAGRNGKPLGHRNSTGRGFEAAAREAGIAGVSFHSMRHAFASRMIGRGIEPVALAADGSRRRALGRYTHLYDRERTHDAIRQAMGSTGR